MRAESRPPPRISDARTARPRYDWADAVGVALSPRLRVGPDAERGDRLALRAGFPVRAGQPKAFPPDNLGRPANGAFTPDGTKVVFEAEPARSRTRIWVQEMSAAAQADQR